MFAELPLNLTYKERYSYEMEGRKGNVLNLNILFTEHFNKIFFFEF